MGTIGNRSRLRVSRHQIIIRRRHCIGRRRCSQIRRFNPFIRRHHPLNNRPYPLGRRPYSGIRRRLNRQKSHFSGCRQNAQQRHLTVTEPEPKGTPNHRLILQKPHPLQNR